MEVTVIWGSPCSNCQFSIVYWPVWATRPLPNAEPEAACVATSNQSNTNRVARDVDRRWQIPIQIGPTRLTCVRAHHIVGARSIQLDSVCGQALQKGLLGSTVVGDSS